MIWKILIKQIYSKNQSKTIKKLLETRKWLDLGRQLYPLD